MGFFCGWCYDVIILKWNTWVISSDTSLFEWYVWCTFETFISPSFLKQEMHESLFCRETTSKNNQFLKWETWIFNTMLDQTKLWRVLLWIRIEIMSAVTSNLSIDNLSTKLLCSPPSYAPGGRETCFNKTSISSEHIETGIEECALNFKTLFAFRIFRYILL